jgi:hypothetical protein
VTAQRVGQRRRVALITVDATGREAWAVPVAGCSFCLCASSSRARHLLLRRRRRHRRIIGNPPVATVSREAKTLRPPTKGLTPLIRSSDESHRDFDLTEASVDYRG